MAGKEKKVQICPTRRSFLKGSAATMALAATAGALSLGEWQAEQAVAADDLIARGPSLCNGCSSKCGLFATTKNGRLWYVEGMKEHPYAKGTLCGRGQGTSQWAYDDERVTTPMKRREDGTFEPISWDQAYREIAEKVAEIKRTAGPEALAMIQDPRPSGKYYTKRFINALGSNNFYTHGAACNLSKESGINQAIGASNFSVDWGNTKMVVFIGRSYGDGIRPSSVKSLAEAADRNTRVVIVDPRLNNAGIFATDWVTIKPGCDIALLLGIANVLITRDLYDHEFVEQHCTGFPEFASQVAEYTPEWAEGVCDVPAEKIIELAQDLAKAAPACAIESSWRAAFGCAYQNSFETARCVCAVNALLGCWGQKGGALITTSPKAGDVDPVKFPPVPKPAGKRVGEEEYPLALSSMGTNLAVIEGCLDGRIEGVFFYNSNALKGYSNPAKWREALDKAKLVVSVDIQMSETCMASDYVLPECTSLERMELPEFIGGKKHYVAMRTQVLQKIHPETKPCDQIFSELADACGVGQYFDFTVEELAEAQLKSVGTSIAEVTEAGIVELPTAPFSYGVPAFATPTGKFQFASEKVGEAGLNPVIGFIPRLVQPKDDEFHFIGGKQSIQSHTMTLNLESLNAVSREYDLERVWLSSADAKKLGVEEGDMVEISSSEATGKVAAKVTERLKPGVVFLPTHYGGTSPYLTRAEGFGINFMDFVPFHMEPGVGAAMTQEVAVKVRKVEA